MEFYNNDHICLNTLGTWVLWASPIRNRFQITFHFLDMKKISVQRKSRKIGKAIKLKRKRVKEGPRRTFICLRWMAKFIGLKYWTFYGTDTPNVNQVKVRFCWTQPEPNFNKFKNFFSVLNLFVHSVQPRDMRWHKFSFNPLFSILTFIFSENAKGIK